MVGIYTPTYEEPHEAMRASVKEFVAREYLKREDEFIERRGFDRRLWLAAGEVGMLGLHIPAEHGGGGVEDYRFAAVAIEEMARASIALASCLSVHFDVVTPYFAKFGTPAQRAAWLPSLATGEAVAAIAMTEPAAGSDLAGMRTKANPRGAGRWSIRGAKTFITNGGAADIVLTAARTGEGRKDISLFAVPTDREGFSRGRKLDKVGLPQADTCELSYEDVVVSNDDLIGDLNAGFDMMRQQLVQERLGSAIANIASAEAALEETIEYARGRTAFGKPLSRIQVTMHALALQVARVEVIRSYVSQCIRKHCDGMLSDTEAAIAKWRSAEVQNAVIDACLQIHGGYGYMTETRVARVWMDARASRIWAGTSEIMAEIVGKNVVV